MKVLTMPAVPYFLGLLLFLALAGLVGCGDNGEEGQFSAGQDTTSVVTTTISDPPTCKGPGGIGDSTFEHVWVTVTRVLAHLSSNADSGGGGWVTLVDLSDDPKQIDLLDTNDAECILAVLGSTTGLPSGKYQQIRMHLLSNHPGQGEATPTPNACEHAEGGGFNCAELSGGDLKTLLLSSQDRNGIKIPPGQLAGGSIDLEAGKSADINIEFNACRSLVLQGNGKVRLKPTLRAGEVSLADAISGRVVVNGTVDALPGPASIVVFAEQTDGGGVDRVVLEKFADPLRGSFILCPLPEGSYDIVVAAIDARGVTYNATITFGVPTGTDLGNIPLEPETGENTSPGTIEGRVTSRNTSGAVETDVSLSALQRSAPESGSEVPVTIPVFGDSTYNIHTEAGTGCPEETACAGYVLEVPASNPLVGTFSGSGTTYSGPAPGSIFYGINARAFNGGEPNCSPSSVSTYDSEGAGALEVNPGATAIAETLAFTGCTEVQSDP